MTSSFEFLDHPRFDFWSYSPEKTPGT